jgi:cation:H+ antiporter
LAGVSPLVAGLTIVAFCTSAPELAVTVSSALVGESDIAIGNIVGSNIANVLMNLGLAALISPLVVTRKLIRVDVPLMVGASVIMFLMALDGLVSRREGMVLIILLGLYTLLSVRLGEKELPSASEEDVGGGRSWLESGALFVVGLGVLVLGGHLLVTSATRAAELAGVSELVVGLTVVAVGTSLPELAVIVVACYRGEREIAIGNVIGSNIFNILCVLGCAAVISPVSVAPSAVGFDIPVMIVVAAACLPIFFYNFRIERWEGGMFLGYYAIYLTYLVLQATEHDALDFLGRATLLFVVPVTVVTFVVIAVRSHRRGSA